MSFTTCEVKGVEKYYDLLKKFNISVVAIDFDQLFTVSGAYQHDHSDIFKNNTDLAHRNKIFFVDLFKKLLNCDDLKIAIVIKLSTRSIMVSDATSLSEFIVRDTYIGYTKLKQYFDHKYYLEKLWKSKKFLEITEGGGEKYKNKITVVPQIICDNSLDYNRRSKFYYNIINRQTSVDDASIATCAFLEDIFKIPIHECIFIRHYSTLNYCSAS